MELANGIYRAVAKSWALAEAGTGSAEVAVEFTFLDPSVQGTITWHGYLTDKAFDRTIESLRYCGWQGDLLDDLTGLDTSEVDLVIENEEYEGKVRPKVRWVNRPGLAVNAPMSPDKAKAFAAEMRSRVRAFDAAGGRKPAAKKPAPVGDRRPEPPPLSDNDISF